MSRNPRQSWIMDSKPRIPDSIYWILDSLSVELAFGFPIFSGIPNSPREISWIPDFPQVKISRISKFLRWRDVMV